MSPPLLKRRVREDFGQLFPEPQSKDCFFVLVLNSFQYQDKEVRKKSRLYEKSTIKDFVHGISNTHRNY